MKTCEYCNKIVKDMSGISVSCGGDKFERFISYTYDIRHGGWPPRPKWCPLLRGELPRVKKVLPDAREEGK